MKIAFATHAARTYPQPRWGGMPTGAEQDALFDWVAEQGFEGLDIGDSWMDLDGLDHDGAQHMRARARDRGLVICGLNLLRKALCSPVHGAASRRSIEHALDVAGWLDCPIVSISLSHPTDQPGASAVTGTTHSPGGSLAATHQDYDITATELRDLARAAAARGLSLSLELHHCSVADTSTGVLRLLHAVNEGNIGANPDLINGYWAYAEPPENWRAAITALAPCTNLWHVKNAQRVYVPESRRAVFLERTLGHGDVDYRWCIGIMRNAGFDGWISIENCGSTDPFSITAEGRRYLEQVQADPITIRLTPPHGG